MPEENVQQLKVSAKSEPKKVAGATAEQIRNHLPVELHAIGAAAINQAAKALAVAKGFVAPVGYELAFVPAFHTTDVEGEERTAMRLIVVHHTSTIVEGETILKVGAKSEPKKVAGAIAEQIRSEQPVELHAIGAAAINQATKALAIARGYVAPVGYDLAYVPFFHTTEVDGEERTAMRLVVVKR